MTCTQADLCLCDFERPKEQQEVALLIYPVETNSEGTPTEISLATLVATTQISISFPLISRDYDEC